MVKLLIVEDDLSFSRILDSFLKKHGYEVALVSSCRAAEKLIRGEQFDLFLLDYRLPDGNGLDLLKLIRDLYRDAPAVLMTGFNDVRTVVKAMKLGAADYITKPVNPDELLMVIKQSLEKPRESPSVEVHPQKVSGFVMGTSRSARKLHEFIDLVAPVDMAVIIQGESGTGKEYVARSIHASSKRCMGPFVPIDCGVLSRDLAAAELFGYVKGAFTGALTDRKGQFETASGGTLFLDEIGNLSYDVQVKLLRVIQEKVVQPVGSDKLIPVDIRLIVATNDNLLKSVEQGSFREDLYHRLNEFKISVPPLRERADDLDEFIRFFISEANRDLSREVYKVSDEVLDIFRSYEWPGNLRELRNTIRRMVLLSTGNVAGKENLPEEMLFIPHSEHKEEAGTNLKAIQEITEKEQIANVLDNVQGNKSKAARLLNIDRKTLYKKMEKYGFK